MTANQSEKRKVFKKYIAAMSAKRKKEDSDKIETFCDKCGKKIKRSAMALKILETKKINPVCYKCQHN